jgi:N6-L-threonylcarbamoyladenine synthase
MITLGIETSCDETSVAVLKNGWKVLSNVIFSSVAEHKKYGGVVPEIASRSHLETILPCLEAALKKARIGASHGSPLHKIDLIAVTQGPGLMGSLLVGVSAAKALAFALKKPLVGVDHVIAHIYAGTLTAPKLRFPYLGLAVSGGHTLLLRMNSAGDVDQLGTTLDDAAGEAYDKVAKILGLGYPGGPEVDRLSRSQDPNKIFFSRPFLSKDSLDFSFSGIKTAVYYQAERLKKSKTLTLKAKKQICAGFQEAICEVLTGKAVKALKKYRLKACVVGGGVSANSRLRQMIGQAARKEKFQVVFPPLSLCQDNAAMIACLGTALYKGGKKDGLDMAAYANFSENHDIHRIP